MNRRDEVRNAFASFMLHHDPERLSTELDRIYGVLPDDGEIATYEWMSKLVGKEMWKLDAHSALLLPQPENQFLKIKDETTRGQFRRLCEALGVELKEVKGE